MGFLMAVIRAFLAPCFDLGSDPLLGFLENIGRSSKPSKVSWVLHAVTSG